MSLVLEMGTYPVNLKAKCYSFDHPLSPLRASFGTGGVVEIGDHAWPMKDFLGVVYDILTALDLEENDYRLQFVKCVAAMKQTDGYPTLYQGRRANPEARRFHSEVDYHVENPSGHGRTIEFGDGYILTMADIVALTYYALENTNLEGEADPRLQFVKSVALMQVSGKRLTSTVPYNQ